MGYLDAIADPLGTRTPFGPGKAWPTRVDQYLAAGVADDELERWWYARRRCCAPRGRDGHRAWYPPLVAACGGGPGSGLCSKR
jgi:hypothetical protein